MEKADKRMGWEVARELETAKPTILERLKPEKNEIVAALWGVAIFFVVFLIGCWLAGNPFEGSGRLPSEIVKAHGWEGTNNWTIFWWVVGLAIILEFLDASAGMGYGAAMTPLLLVMGFDPKQVVPAVMIQQATAGMIGAFLHKEFGNVEWRFKPMSEPIKLWLMIAVTGCITVGLSVTAVYAVFKVHKVWIKLYVVVLLLMMGGAMLIKGRKERPYRPFRMLGFAALAGFNKGVGGGGYGPVVTVGGLLSGVPVKSMLAVTALSEGTTCVFSIFVWLALSIGGGMTIDYLVLPSMLLGSMVAAIAAPYAVKVFPEKAWRWVVPIYCIVLGAYSFYKIGPALMKQLGG
ncbi:sulfite exporter TauE/SafE family protein [uncultured Desulfosarcina sp.]|uniref:sulfite exporter TauE/SafE family protein n=1 Tax=uncultured Desulfosarcina sp. TaxID=218289 RepID=UPI0029C79729|nr:sulfite exporter TauE/SafE family protein [uncultured Desulfosarcina sp.]